MSGKKQAGRARRVGERKRPDVSFNFGANAKPKGRKRSGLASKYAAGGS